jgi:leucyl-tRNA synthetase
MKPYDHKKIEKKLQKEWETKGVYKTLDPKAAVKAKKKPYYVLDMFPYPSGQGLHVGHPRGYIASDVFARMKRAQGFNVLHPMGYDAFGLPAEQYAVQHNVHPEKAVDINIKTFRKQLQNIGFSYDWTREVNTTDPEYYKWTQWIFLQIYNSWYDKTKQKARPIADLVTIFEKSGNASVNAVSGDVQPFTAKEWKAFSELEQQQVLMKYRLAYEGFAEVNWCAELGTVLANDEVIEKDGKMVSERGEYPVVKKSMRQWFMRITAYADRLLSGLDTIDWSDSIKEIQRNWIGKSEGSEITFSLENKEFGYFINNVDVFTTRADTLFGVSYIALAVDHPLVETLLKKEITNWDKVHAYIQDVKNQDKNAAQEISGIKLEGIVAKQSFMGDEFEVPVYLTNYVLAGYGTGAVMGVPAHDERDFEFANKYGLPIKKVLSFGQRLSSTEEMQNLIHGMPSNTRVELKYECWPGYGNLINSGEFNGLTSEKAKKAITEFAGGKLVTKYRMRDAIFARQRYWGEPIPLVHEKDGTIKSVSEKNLPLKLPNVKSYQPSGTGESPLATVPAWVKAGYETNTMPGWTGSSWYFLRYTDPQNKKSFAGEEKLDYWFGNKGGVDMYVGGAEHATGHLLYSRFWHKVLKDLGYVKTEEPFKALRNQGMIGGADGRKMSKRWGNVINPDDVVATYGADTLRVFEMFLGPFESHLPWSTEGIIGSRRFLERVWKVGSRVLEQSKTKTQSESLQKLLHKTIKKVGDDIQSFNLNTAVSSMMILTNEMEKTESVSVADFKTFLQLLAPFAPHMAEELWNQSGEKTKPNSKNSVVRSSEAGFRKSIHIAPWPKFDAKKLVEDSVTIGVQINGKVRGQVTLAVDADTESAQAAALALPEIQKWMDGVQMRKFVYVPGKIVNIVVG